MAALQITDVRPVPGPGHRWTVLQFPLTRIVLAIVPIIVVVVAGQLLLSALDLTQTEIAGSLIAMLASAATVAVYAGYVRLVERRRVLELGTDRLLGELGRGLGLGIGLFAATIAVLLVAGCATIERGGGVTALVPGLFLALAAALAEEIVFRGVLFRIVEESLGSWIALAISAACFGAAHLFNPDASVLGTIAIALEAGVLLAAAYMWSRRLWLPIGLHTGWNFAQIGIFGVELPGRTIEGALSSRFSGPTILTGGSHGSDVSIVAVALCLAVAVTLLVLAKRRGRILRPSA